MTALVMTLGAALVVLASRTSRAMACYVVLAAAETFAYFSAIPHTALYLGPLAISTLLKMVIAPVAVGKLIRSAPAADELRPSLTMPARIAIVIGLLWLSRGAAGMPALAGFDLAGTVAFALLCGAAVMVIDRSLMAGIVGLLVLDAGATAAGASIASELPAALDLAAAFDALVVAVVAVMLVRSIAVHDASLDVRTMRRLRG